MKTDFKTEVFFFEYPEKKSLCLLLTDNKRVRAVAAFFDMDALGSPLSFNCVKYLTQKPLGFSFDSPFDYEGVGRFYLKLIDEKDDYLEHFGEAGPVVLVNSLMSGYSKHFGIMIDEMVISPEVQAKLDELWKWYKFSDSLWEYMEKRDWRKTDVLN